MQLERFNFKEFSEAPPQPKMIDGKPFIATRSVKPVEAELPPPPPTFSEEQLKSAERDGYQKGFLQGTQEGRKQAENEQADVERKLTDTVATFAQSLSPLFIDYHRIALEMKEQLPKVALAIARKVADKALDEHAEQVICDVALTACQTMVGEHTLSITVHESVADALTGKLEKLASSLPATTDIEILRDAAIPVADCRIAWSNGGLERNTANLWQQIEHAVNNLMLTARRDAGEQLELLSSQLGLPPVSTPTTPPKE